MPPDVFPLWHGATSLADALAQGSFMAISAQTSTGFSLISYDLWPFVCQLLMLILMFIGGMSGSTTGGIKVIRYFIVLKLIKNKIESLFRPEVVRVLKVGDKEITSKDRLDSLDLLLHCDFPRYPRHLSSCLGQP